MDPPETLDGEKVKKRSALEQKQRALERKVRKAKRLVAGSFDSEQIRQNKKKLREAQKELREFVEAHSDILRRDYSREKIYTADKPKTVDNSGESGIIKNIELPPETNVIRSMSKETKQLISDAFDKVRADYDVQIDEIKTQPLQANESNVPFQFQPVRGKDGELLKRIVINSNYDFMGSQEQMQARILRNFNNGVLASNSIEGLIAHEAAHVMTFQNVKTYTGYLLENKIVSKQFVSGISGYADACQDGSECIAEAFSALRCQQSISVEAQALIDKYIEGWRKK